MIKELEEFGKELKLYRQNQTLPQGEVKNKLVDIYEANYSENKHWGVARIDRGCPTCISDMMKSLSAEWYSNLVDFKAVPQQRTIEDQIEEETRAKVEFINSMLNKEDVAEVVSNEVVSINLEELSWGKLKAHAASKGINTKGKKKQQILDELKELDD